MLDGHHFCDNKLFLIFFNMVRLFSILELSDVPLLSGCYSCKWNIINQSGNIIQKGNTQTYYLIFA